MALNRILGCLPILGLVYTKRGVEIERHFRVSFTVSLSAFSSRSLMNVDRLTKPRSMSIVLIILESRVIATCSFVLSDIDYHKMISSINAINIPHALYVRKSDIS